MSAPPVVSVLQANIVSVVKAFLGRRRGSDKEARIERNETSRTHGYAAVTEPQPTVTPSSDTCSITSMTIKDFLKIHRILPGHNLQLLNLTQASKSIMISKTIRRIKKICPNLRTLILQDINFLACHRKQRVKLQDFPPRLNSLSLRGSVIDIKTLLVFTKQQERATSITILDLGSCFFVNDEKSKALGPSIPWPAMPYLQEVYLDGCPFLNSSISIQDMTLCSPALRVINVEGTKLDVSDFQSFANLHQLEELYIGHSNVNDSHLMSLEKRAPLSLQVVCLVRTYVTGVGLASLCQSSPDLRSVRLEKSRCSYLLRDFRDRHTGVKFEWPGGFRVDGVLMDQCCDHYHRKYPLRAS